MISAAKKSGRADGLLRGVFAVDVDKKHDGVIGRWTANDISALDAEKARLVYGNKTP